MYILLHFLGNSLSGILHVNINSKIFSWCLVNLPRKVDSLLSKTNSVYVNVVKYSLSLIFLCSAILMA